MIEYFEEVIVLSGNLYLQRYRRWPEINARLERSLGILHVVQHMERAQSSIIVHSLGLFRKACAEAASWGPRGLFLQALTHACVARGP